MTYTQAQIDKANAVDLEKFLRAQGETLVRSGKEYRWKTHDSLTVCGNKWFRHSQSKGGFPVDFVMEFYGKSFPEAVQMLTGETGKAQPEADPAPSPAFRLPLRNVTNANILNYLTQERKLSPSLVNFFIAAGDIYEDTAHHNVVFVGRDADGHPRYASSRGIREKFRQDAAGAEKAFGFAHRGTDKQLLVFEAPIDLLSFIELFPKNWQQHNYLSLGGVSAKALQQFLSERPDMERVFLCLDADKAGEDACKRLAGLLPDTVSVTRIQPCMKDWNDVLVHRAEIPNRNYFKSIVLKEPSKPETVKIIRMSDVELTPVEWLWKPYLPFGKLSVLQGNPGEGKTYFAMHLAAACTNGKLLPTGHHRPDPGVSRCRCGHEPGKRSAPHLHAAGTGSAANRLRYFADWAPEQSRRNAEPATGSRFHRHRRRRPQRHVHRQAETRPHHAHPDPRKKFPCPAGRVAGVLSGGRGRLAMGR